MEPRFVLNAASPSEHGDARRHLKTVLEAAVETLSRQFADEAATQPFPSADNFLKMTMSRLKPPVFTSETHLQEVCSGKAPPSEKLLRGLGGAFREWSRTHPEFIPHADAMEEAVEAVVRTAKGAGR